MKNILIVSDTHGNWKYLEELLEKAGPLDLVIHLGDANGEEKLVRKLVSCPLELVAGNNGYGELPRKKIIQVEKYRIFLTHGHLYHVNYTFDYLAKEAEKLGCQIAMCGHTHVPMIHSYPNVTVVNPGSLALPRQAGKKPSFVRMDIDREGEAHFAVNYVEPRSGIGWDMYS